MSIVDNIKTKPFFDFNMDPYLNFFDKNINTKKNEKKYTLRDITDKDFEQLNKMDMKDTFSNTDSKGNWYNQRYKQFREMLNAFNVLDEFKQLKSQGNRYSFTERNKSFILMLFREYNGKFEHLKRGDVRATDGAYLLEVYMGVLDIFYDSNADDELINSVMLKMWNRLNIPQRESDAILDSVCEQCKKMVQTNINSASLGMGLNDKLFWQNAFRYSFYEFIYHWDRYYKNMQEIRKDEIFEKKDDKKINEDLENYAMITFEFSSEIDKAIKNDSELKCLYKELDKLLGVGKKRRPLIRDIEKDYAKYNQRISKRKNEVILNVIHQHIPDYKFPEELENQTPVGNELMSPKELLKTAMAEEKEQREWSQIMSIEDLLDRIKCYFP